MKPPRHYQLLLLALGCTTLGAWLRADEPPATPPPAAPAAETPPPPPVPAEASKPEAVQAAVVAPAEAAPPQAAVAPAGVETPPPAPEAKLPPKRRSSGDGDKVVVGDDNHIPAGITVAHDAVAVMGDLTVDGEVTHDAVAVMGNNTINGRVRHNAVAIMGDLSLGPKAVVDGDLVCIGGEIHRDPAAVVRGRMEVRSFGPGFKVDSLSNWWDHALKIGRPLAIGAHLGWLWILTGFSIAFYALLGLVFPRQICACGDKLVQEPGLVILSAVLAVLALPVLFVLLCITIIGIPIALFVVPVGCLFIAMFGKAAIYGLIGRRLTGDRFHPALAVIIGALLAVLFYLLPVLGLLLSLLVWFLGFGCAVLSMFGRAKPGAPVTAVSRPAPAPVMPAAASAGPADAFAPEAAAVEPPPLSAGASVVAAMVVTADTAPRAGFWIRVAAALLDFLMIVIPCGMMGVLQNGPGPLFIGLAVYHAVMWNLKGTTIGGIICSLKVVRLDDRPLDWGVAIVRALGGFLSLFVAGLGFLWVAFDDEKQSWHDKIAGTTIVRVPKGTSLL